MTDYVINLDEDLWIAVPPSFPFGDWLDGAAWAAEIAAAAVPSDLDARERFEHIARGVAGLELPNVTHVLWFVPLDGRDMGLAYVTVAECAQEQPNLEDVALLDIMSATPIQLSRHISQQGTNLIQSAATLRLSDLGDDRGLAAGVAGSIRTVGVTKDLLFMINAVDENLAVLAMMQQPMIDLFDCIELLETPEEVDRAAEYLRGVEGA